MAAQHPGKRARGRRIATTAGACILAAAVQASAALGAKDASVNFAYKTTETIQSSSVPADVGKSASGTWVFRLGHEESSFGSVCAVERACKDSKPPFPKITRGYVDADGNEHYVFLTRVKRGTYEGEETFRYIDYETGCSGQRTETYRLVVKKRKRLKHYTDSDAQPVKPFWRATRIEGTRTYDIDGTTVPPPNPSPFQPECESGPSYHAVSSFVGTQKVRDRPPPKQNGTREGTLELTGPG